MLNPTWTPPPRPAQLLSQIRLLTAWVSLYTGEPTQLRSLPCNLWIWGASWRDCRQLRWLTCSCRVAENKQSISHVSTVQITSKEASNSRIMIIGISILKTSPHECAAFINRPKRRADPKWVVFNKVKFSFSGDTEIQPLRIDYWMLLLWTLTAPRSPQSLLL